MAGNKQHENSVEIRLGTWNICTLNGNGLEICEELLWRNVDMCCIQEVRLRGCGARLIGLQGRKYDLWWSVNQEGYVGVGVQVKGELHDKVVDVRRVNDRVMSLAIVLLEVLRFLCAYAPQCGHR